MFLDLIKFSAKTDTAVPGIPGIRSSMAPDPKRRSPASFVHPVALTKHQSLGIILLLPSTRSRYIF
jgi:hypothetical protein